MKLVTKSSANMRTIFGLLASWVTFASWQYLPTSRKEKHNSNCSSTCGKKAIKLINRIYNLLIAALSPNSNIFRSNRI